LGPHYRIADGPQIDYLRNCVEHSYLLWLILQILRKLSKTQT
jgi:hypothetical protein